MSEVFVEESVALNGLPSGESKQYVAQCEDGATSRANVPEVKANKTRSRHSGLGSSIALVGESEEEDDDWQRLECAERGVVHPLLTQLGGRLFPPRDSAFCIYLNKTFESACSEERRGGELRFCLWLAMLRLDYIATRDACTT